MADLGILRGRCERFTVTVSVVSILANLKEYLHGIDTNGPFHERLNIFPWDGQLKGIGASPQQGDIWLSGPPSGQGAGGGARTRDRKVPAALSAGLLSLRHQRLCVQDKAHALQRSLLTADS
ncbi:hypothetical protein PoB_000790200 [Plakobranchus ocellatus]|uniref:Uncharacterized protein n=1 Tax=Plakobranchus ocellatus TaxID=259542 RepID=A0AAV3YGP7_9GAST|nr:hypothetical protein PoB_000790200 [Plakobranchus ocellatus]